MACRDDGLTMAEVAKQAGLSRQAVYLHFSDRDALLSALLDRLEGDTGSRRAMIESAPSARAAVTAWLASLAEDYPRLAPLAGLAAHLPAWRAREEARLSDCLELTERFRTEGALSPHLKPATAADLLWSLTSLAVWRDLVTGRGWSTERYKSHIAFLAAAALTH